MLTQLTDYLLQVINMSKIHKAEAKAKEAAGLPPTPTPAVTDTESGTKEEQPTHIAFGSKVVIPPHARKPSREGSLGSAGGRSSREGSGRSSGLQHSNSVPHLRSNSPSTEPESSRESSRQTHRLSYQRSVSEATGSESPKPQLGVEATQTTIQPRPPRTGSGNKTRRRPVRVRGSNSAKAHSSSASRKTSEVLSTEVDDAVSSGDRTSADKDESDSYPESISRSQSESSLKMSGNEGSLGESFQRLQDIKRERSDSKGIDKSLNVLGSDPKMGRNSANLGGDAHVGRSKPGVNEDSLRTPANEHTSVENKYTEKSELKSNGHVDEARSKDQQTLAPKILKDSIFTFSSRPRSAPRSPRTRRKSKSQDTRNTGNSPDAKPEIQITGESTESESGVGVGNRARRESERSEYDEDFYKASGESSEDEDDLQKLLKSSNNSRSSSRGSRRSPLSSIQSSGEPQVAPSPQCLRTSIRSSLLKEVSIFCVFTL